MATQDNRNYKKGSEKSVCLNSSRWSFLTRDLIGNLSGCEFNFKAIGKYGEILIIIHLFVIIS